MRTRRLIVVTPEGERDIPFIGRLTAGRAPDCDISIADTKISRRHAEFDASGPTPRVTDLGSRNGILVNGRKVGSADLAPGDVVTIGDARLQFEELIVAPPLPIEMPAPGVDDRTARLPLAHRTPAPVATSPSLPAAMGTVMPDASMRVALGNDPGEAVDDVPFARSEDRTLIVPRRAVAAAPPSAPSLDGRPAAPPPHVAPAFAAAAPVEAGLPLAPAHDVAAEADPAAAMSAGPPQLSLPPAPTSDPEPVPVAPAAPAGSVPHPTAGPRLPWGGFVTMLLLLLVVAGMLLGVMPLLSARSAMLDVLAGRHARTLVTWLASAVRADGTIDQAIVDAVGAQDGVTTAVLVDAPSGRAVAPTRLAGRSMPDLPGAASGVQVEGAIVVTSSRDTVRDALVPVARGPAPRIAWVRYDAPAGTPSTVAMVAAPVTALVLSLLAALLLKRHTAATLQFFARQVELASSPSAPQAIPEAPMPGLQHLSGVVSDLLLGRHHDDHGVAAHGPAPHAPSPIAATPLPAAWIKVSPSLSIVGTSANAGPGIVGWETARGRHLLDLITERATREAVIQALGALGMAAGSEVTAPVAGRPALSLRRECSGQVRVTFTMP